MDPVYFDNVQMKRGINLKKKIANEYEVKKCGEVTKE